MRLMTFAYLPLMGMSLALQAMVGNNYGAGQWYRSNATLRLALILSFAYSAALELGLVLLRGEVGGLFVGEARVQAEIASILPTVLACYFSFGPMLMISSYFQSIGDAKRSAILALCRTYLFAIPLTLTLPLGFGAHAVWLAVPLADAMLVVSTIAVLVAQPRHFTWGLFRTA